MKNFWAYLQERFPLHANGVLIASYFTANYLLANSSTLQRGEALEISWRFPAGCIVLLFMFFHMRVIDEHKDFEQDRMVHPDRILSRGLITLKQLRNVGWFTVAVEVVLSYFFGAPAFFMCLVLLAFSWLIYKEFYIGEILENHLLANAFLHLIVMPAYSLYVFTVITDRFPWTAPTPMLLYAWVSYGVGLAYELARKTRAPADERPGLLTYSHVMGPYPPAWGALLALIFSGVISALVGLLMDFAWWYHAVVLALLSIVAFGVFHFRLRTTTTTAANLQIYAGMFIFAFDILLAAELIRLHGLMFT
ncbi:MAG TPA: UbiA family prenyltransferase [Anaerolineales bacterium]|nr:UbiA family prenyltransferase [Anaerolineales bacterium]